MNHWIQRYWIVLLSLLLVAVAAAIVAPQPANAAPAYQSAAEGEQIFKQMCASCHTIGGGRLVGPDLQGVTAQRDAAWLKAFITNPETLFAQQDEQALQLLEAYNGVRMPNMGLSEPQVTAVLMYLSSSPGSPTQPQAAVLPPGQALAGQKLFNGETRFANGGTACAACHQGQGAGFLGGGSLGPDLTHVFARYGEAGLVSNLSPVAFPSMQGAFQNQPISEQELADLIAYFRASDQQGSPATVASQSAVGFMLGIGAGGAVLLFGILALFWPRQRQSLGEQLRSKR